MASIVRRGSSYSVVYYTKENGIRKQKWESFRSEKDALHRKYVVEHSQQVKKELAHRPQTVEQLIQEYSAMWDPQLLELLRKLSSSSGKIFVVESLKSATRNFEKLMDILEFLLTHDLKFVSTNFYMENGHVERRVKPLRAGHTSKEIKKNLSQTAGLGYRHAAALNHL